ncbi:MAG: hypothetical protein Q7T86_07390 [Hyphomicrobiaceae bacterium]|nr:hypothetical protein [Hyphomicrobiaceae bacterium]
MLPSASLPIRLRANALAVYGESGQRSEADWTNAGATPKQRNVAGCVTRR